MRLVKHIVCIAILGLLPSIASAQVLACQLEQRRSNGGWIPANIVFGIEQGNPDVVMGLGFGDGPMYQASGRINRETGNRTIIGFRLDGGTSGTNQYVNMSYTLNYNRSNQRVTVTGRPLGYANNFRSTGTCQVQR